jgi:hypothetical protein
MRMPSFWALGLLTVVAGTARADPPLPGCIPHLADMAPACGDPGRSGRPTDGCCPNSCSFANDADCCTNGDQVCLDTYGCSLQNDSDCCTSGDKVCRRDLGCDEKSDTDCKASGVTDAPRGGCSMAGAALPPLLATGLLLLLGLLARRRATVQRAGK